MQNIIEKDHGKVQLGLVISYFGNSVAVETDDGQVFQCHLRRNQALPVVGDKVYFEGKQDKTGTVLEIELRHSLLSRGDGRGNMKPVAANVDVIAIVMAPPPIFSEYLIDRHLIAAELLNITPLIVLNKIDLLDDTTEETAFNKLKPYQQIPYSVLLTSIYQPETLEALGDYLKGKTAVLVGPSGVGKSSIIATLSQNGIRIGEVTAKGAGKHTTTATRLYHLVRGGHLIDSPGVREFSLWPVNKKDILKGFKEFFPYIGTCKFRDCLHTVEPGCAVEQAANEGKISRERLLSYQNLIKKSHS